MAPTHSEKVVRTVHSSCLGAATSTALSRRLGSLGAMLLAPCLGLCAFVPHGVLVRPAFTTRSLPAPSMLDAGTLLATTSAIEKLSNPLGDPIGAAFEFVTLVPQPFWLLIVFAPNWKGTRAIFEPIQPIALIALVHLFIVVLSTQGSPETGTAPLDLFNHLFDPNYDGVETFLELATYKNFISEEWTHTLIWDLFVARYIWLDGRRRGIFTSHSVLLTNAIGPPGLLLHLATCLIVGKGLPTETVDVVEQPPR